MTCGLKTRDIRTNNPGSDLYSCLVSGPPILSQPTEYECQRPTLLNHCNQIFTVRKFVTSVASKNSNNAVVGMCRLTAGTWQWL